MLVTITSAAGLIYLIGLTGAFLGLLIGMTCAVPLIERQYARQTMEHRVTLGGLARPMASRISTALLVLIVPASLLEWASVNRTIYWLAEAIVVLVILGLLMREPIWRTARQLLELRWFQ